MKTLNIKIISLVLIFLEIKRKFLQNKKMIFNLKIIIILSVLTTCFQWADSFNIKENQDMKEFDSNSEVSKSCFIFLEI
jgi:hypothetical protein